MKFYYLSTESNQDRDFEIHQRECPRIPSFHKRIYLGPFHNSEKALQSVLKNQPRTVICLSCQKGLPQSSYCLDNNFSNSNPNIGLKDI
jgi:hypothetical protein